MTKVIHKFFSMYLFLFITMYCTCFVLIIRREKLYQYNSW